MDDIGRSEERRQERIEAILIAGSALLMLSGVVLLIAAAWLARYERTVRLGANTSPISIGTRAVAPVLACALNSSRSGCAKEANLRAAGSS